jgi:bifunctional non-homologous end joining protein LigD
MAKASRRTFEVDGVEVSVSNPDKIYFPDARITKLELVEYYRAVAQPALRAVAGRPIVLKRYVNGIAEEGFYQKRAPDPRPEWVETVTLRFPSGRRADEVVLRNEAQLIWVVNLGCLELHAHPVSTEALEQPDELRVDLDPVPGVEWAQVRDVGLVTREVLTELGLVGWPKTSGSRGLHIYARIAPRWSFTQVRRAALAIAREVERRAPGLATSRWWKEEREGVFLDYNQNAKDRTMAAAWSVRPRPDARVSMPLTWAELEVIDPAQFTLRTAPARYREVGDPHAGMGAAVGDLTAALALVEAHEAEGLGDAAWPPHFQKQAGEPVRAQPSRRRSVMPLVEIGRAKLEADAQAGLQRWRDRHPEVVPHLEPADVLVDKMRGRHSVWIRIRVNLQHVPEALRPPQEALDPDYDVASEWAGLSAGAVELPQLPGVSDAKLWALHEALGVTSVEELEEAARAGRLRGVKGFGAKTEASILAAIERARVRNTRWLASEALAALRPLQDGLSALGARAEVAGDLRRGLETVEAGLLVVGAPEPDGVMDHLRGLPGVLAAEPRGEGEARLLLEAGPPVVVRVVPLEAWGAARLAATGDDAHLAALGARAQARGLVLGPRGLFQGGAPVAAPSEADAARALGVPLVPAELRAGAAPLDADASALAVLEVGDIQGMVHCHTTWSDGQASIEELARAAEALGYRYLTITDHSGSAFYANGLDAKRLQRQWDELDEVQARVGITLLKGTEADILADGSLDFPDRILERLDVVVASVHNRFKLAEAEMTRRLVAAMQRPIFKIWGHPLGRMLLRREPVAVRLDEVLDAIAEAPAAIEINADPRRLDLPPEYIAAARRRNIPFVVSVDAHSVAGLGVLPFGVALARRAGVTAAEVLNTRDAAGFAAAVRPAR